MSNTFSHELHQVIKDVYTDLESRELVQENNEKAAKLGVYYAHGATDKASKKLKGDQEKAAKAAEQLAETAKATEASRNTVTAATAAATDARNTNSTASTAAANIQAAANALTDLSADVAAILAVANAKDFGSKIQKLASNAYDLTSSAAEKAENTTLQSLNTTIEAAQSRATVSLSLAKNLDIDIANLYKTLRTNFEALQARTPTNSDSLAKAIASENEKKGVYQTALAEEKAILFSEAFINEKVNSDLKYVKVGTLGEQFKVSFLPFNTVRQVVENGEIKEENALKEYRIIFTSVDDAVGFDINAAKATSNFVPFTPPTSLTPAGPTEVIEAHESAPYVLSFSLADRRPQVKKVAIDHAGKALERGIPYVVFVYVEYTSPNQIEPGNTDGYLSQPSLPFVLRTNLPKARKPRLHFYRKKMDTGNGSVFSNAMRVSFTVNKLMHHQLDMSEFTDFRVFLFREEDQVASTINHLLDDQMDALLLIDEDYRMAEQVLLNAQQAYDHAVAENINVAAAQKELAAAKQDYEKKEAPYNTQLSKIEVLNQAKTSNFFLDRDILNSIPVAFGINAEADTSETKATKKSKRSFVAINENGDFTDNYGEPLITGQAYTAMVFSVVKASKPEATPVYRTSISMFSDAVIFDLA